MLAQHDRPVTLEDTRVYLIGETAEVTTALAEHLRKQGSEIRIVERLEEVDFSADSETLLIAHYSGTPALEHRLPLLKRDKPEIKVILLHEITEREHIDSALLSVIDHLLEKPFTIQALQKALSALHFQPLAGKLIYVFTATRNDLASQILQSLGAQIITEAGAIEPKTPPELAVMTPEAIDDSFRVALAVFRQFCPTVPIFLLYNPQAAGTLDSDILREVAYLVQQPVSRQALRRKLLAYFEQPEKERRKNPRKKGISQVWISAFNTDLGLPEIFESPYLIDISQSGLSFRTHIRYSTDQLMVIWIVAEEYPDKIIELRGQIRWSKQDKESGKFFQYGLEFTKQDTEAWRTFARMVAMQ